MTRRFRPRKEIKFWLYRDIALEAKMIEYIEYLRHTRQFAKTIRNGLRLMWTLGEGDTSVLFELFPTLRSQFNPDNTTLIEEFRQMLQAQAVSIPQFAPSEAASGAVPKALPVPSIAMPTFEDDDQDTVIVRRDESASVDASANFLNAAFGMAGIKAATAVTEPAATKHTKQVVPPDDDNDPPPSLTASDFALKPLG